MSNLKDKNYTKSFVLYKILWYPHLNALERLVLEAILSAEQEYHKTIANRFNTSLTIVITFNQLMELTGIGNVKTLKKCISTLEELNLIKVKRGKRIGIASEFTPVKPIPVPTEITIPSWYETVYGKDKINIMINELKSLHRGEELEEIVAEDIEELLL